MAGLKDKTEKDLIKNLRETEEALRAFRFALAGSKTRNVREGRAHRKNIARIKTEFRSREAKPDSDKVSAKAK